MKNKMITGGILAGGRATRMGGVDKGLQILEGKPLYLHIADKLSSHVDHILISANRNLDEYRKSHYPVITDEIEDFAGPLAGMLAVLKNAQTPWVIFVPCDVPYFPVNLVKNLYEQKGDALASYVYDGNREHPTLSLLNRRVIPMLEKYLAQGDRKLMLFMKQIGAKPVLFADQAEAFINLNTLQDIQKAHK
ncbi:molybdenum cofactor guanylyltransferase MobA [Proteus myxofaciens]|uniref:Molybdenum cofactor guanylyltransferase n=1 Tax=Proteus myxofaciens ATCC 19692 TaxID=1354337 RepID=A0A198G1U5_9GAMM|nr:molybdenum cofactor guanylyltransferase MobA [Proteus myxofaciens]OAT30920.1 molybdopterin-guanine dinucleotide biosynthesis protein [Proteus myxofaciens ATCC 19692]